MKNKAVIFILFAATALLYTLWWKGPLLGDLDNKIYDFLSASDTKPPRTQTTVIVEIDEKSLEILGQWPWPRVVMAELLKKIGSMHPSATAVDMIFPEPDRTSPEALGKFYRDFFHLQTRMTGLPKSLVNNDKLLADAMMGMNVTFPLFFDPSASVQKGCYLPSALPLSPQLQTEGLFYSPYLLCNLPILQHAARGAGHIQASPDNDGIFRRLPLFIRHNGLLIPTLGVAVASTLDPDINVYSKEWNRGITAHILGHTVKADQKSQVLLRFYPQEWYRSVSAIDVLSGRTDPALFEGKIVLIGASAMGLYDHYTFSDGTIRPGIYAHATLIENLLDDVLISQPSFYQLIAFFLSFVMATLLMILMWFKKYLHVLASFAIMVVVGVGASILMLQKNVYISIGYFLIPLTVYLFGLAIVLFGIYYRDQKLFYEKMSKADEAMIDSMALVAETRDTETGAHIARTKEYIYLMARYLASKGLYRDVLTTEYITNLYHAAPLHDIGKVGIPDGILKKNAKLTAEEFEVMKTHTTIGKEVIGNAMEHYQDNMMLVVAHNIAYGHHEKWDGSGYPNALSGESIPLEARMMALADVYDALISRRCYKEAFSFEEAEKIILEGRGRHFDPVLVDAFIVLKKKFRRIARRTAAMNLHGSEAGI